MHTDSGFSLVVLMSPLSAFPNIDFADTAHIVLSDMLSGTEAVSRTIPSAIWRHFLRQVRSRTRSHSSSIFGALPGSEGKTRTHRARLGHPARSPRRFPNCDVSDYKHAARAPSHYETLAARDLKGPYIRRRMSPLWAVWITPLRRDVAVPRRLISQTQGILPRSSPTHPTDQAHSEAAQ